MNKWRCEFADGPLGGHIKEIENYEQTWPEVIEIDHVNAPGECFFKVKKGEYRHYRDGFYYWGRADTRMV